LFALFFSSVASTAPRWFSSFCRQSTPAGTGREGCAVAVLCLTAWHVSPDSRSQAWHKTATNTAIQHCNATTHEQASKGQGQEQGQG
jgi:hypothetical protein